LGFASGMWRVKGKPFRKFERKGWVSRVECAEFVREKRKLSVEVARDGRWGSGVRQTVGEVDDEDKTWYFCVCGFRGERRSVGEGATTMS